MKTSEYWKELSVCSFTPLITADQSDHIMLFTYHFDNLINAF